MTLIERITMLYRAIGELEDSSFRWTIAATFAFTFLWVYVGSCMAFGNPTSQVIINSVFIIQMYCTGKAQGISQSVSCIAERMSEDKIEE